MPWLEKYSSKNSGNSKFRKGLEQINFYTTDPVVGELFLHPAMRELTPELILATTNIAKSTALLRVVALNRQTEGLEVCDPGNKMKRFAESLRAEFRIGEPYKDSTDGGKTTSYVIPVHSDTSAIEIVVNPAWGALWRVTENHPLARHDSPMTITHHPDLSSFSEDGYCPGSCYLSPEVLAEVTHPGVVDINTLAADIQNLALEICSGPHQLSYQRFSGNRYTLSLAAQPDSLPEISFSIEEGLKRVGVRGSNGEPDARINTLYNFQRA